MNPTLPNGRPSRGPEPVGLIPAAGSATRLGSLPCSKEILPIGLWEEGSELAGTPKVASHYLLERMHRGGVRRAHVVLREGKWDIPAFLGSGRGLDMSLCYHLADVPYGPAYSLNEAYPFVRGRPVVTGFPDLLFEPADAFAHLLARLGATGADIVLGLFPPVDPAAMDMVAVGPEGAVRNICIKDPDTNLEYTWIIAAWAPRFTDFMHLYLDRVLENRTPEEIEALPEAHVGTIIRAALDGGLAVNSVTFPEGRCADIGTPEGFLQVLRGGSGAAGSPAGEEAW